MTETPKVKERVRWVDEDGVGYTIERVAPGVAAVRRGDQPIGRAPVSSALPDLREISTARAQELVEAALRIEALRRWESEGGNVPAAEPDDEV